MTDEEALQQAADAAEAEAAALELELATLTEQRRALSAEALAALEERHQALSRSLQALAEEEETLRAELARLEHQLERPPFHLPAVVATPLGWFLRATAFIVYAGSVVSAHRFLQSPGLVVALLVALPIAFLAVMMAGSLRESGAAGTPGERAGPGEEPARLPAVDARAVAAPGGPGDDGAAERPVGEPGARDRSGD